MLTVPAAVAMARAAVGMLHPRWEHVQGVGRTAEGLATRTAAVTPVLVRAAWLHDVGYGPAARQTGFHPLDGARFLRDKGLPAEVTSLVAHHTGAAVEAEQRGLSAELAEFAPPDQDALDLLTLMDLTTTPLGHPTHEADRLTEVLSRYPPEDPVHRAITRSRASLLSSALRARSLAGLSDDWPLCRQSGSPDGSNS